MDINTSNPEALRETVDAVNKLTEYLRLREEQGSIAPNWGLAQLLPDPVQLPDESSRPTMAPRNPEPIPASPLATIAGMRLIEGGDSDTAEADPYSIHHHYSYSGATASFPREDTIYSQDGFLYSSLLINLTVRKCASDLPTTIIDHPGYKKPVISGGMWGVGGGIPIDTYSGDDDTWLELSYGAFDDAGVDMGHGNQTITGFSIHARITVEGTLELRATKDEASPWLSCVITGAIWRVKHSTPPYIQEVGLGGCHDDDIWPNNLWTGIL